MMLIYVFGMTLAWVPIVGSGFSALILPSITVGLFIAGRIRAPGAIVDHRRHGAGLHPHGPRQRAGLGEGRLQARAAQRHDPAVTLLGIQIAVLIGGAVVTENVFARPGLGTMLVEAVLNKDLPLVQALVVYTTAAYVIVNLVIDLLYGLIDPRVQAGRA